MLYCTFGFKEKKSYLTLFCIEEKYEKLIVATFFFILTGCCVDYCFIDDILIQFSCL